MKHQVTFRVFATITVSVDADSLDEAHELACDKADVNLCWSCARHVNTDGGVDDESAVIEVDGETYRLEAGTWVKEE